MSRSQREKGKLGERRARDIVKSWGINARRGVQYRGDPEAPDVVCEADIYVEAKWRAAGHPGKWLAEAAVEAPLNHVPCVIHKRPRQPELVTLYAEHVPAFVDAVRRAIAKGQE